MTPVAPAPSADPGARGPPRQRDVTAAPAARRLPRRPLVALRKVPRAHPRTPLAAATLTAAARATSPPLLPSERYLYIYIYMYIYRYRSDGSKGGLVALAAAVSVAAASGVRGCARGTFRSATRGLRGRRRAAGAAVTSLCLGGPRAPGSADGAGATGVIFGVHNAAGAAACLLTGNLRDARRDGVLCHRALFAQLRQGLVRNLLLSRHPHSTLLRALEGRRNFFGAARCRAVARGHLRRLGILFFGCLDICQVHFLGTLLHCTPEESDHLLPPVSPSEPHFLVYRHALAFLDGRA
mmetsp:Transcript_3385/g.8448  ORF Transcript_3385/g.8448 Transcript_3385/m.8448 type:complete len:296 (-) Transcript_3385:747-1634(-)